MRALARVAPDRSIDLTQSILSKRDRLRTELQSAMDDFVVGQEEAKMAIINTVLNGLFSVYREE